MELTTEKRCIDLSYLSIGIGHSPLVKRIEFRQYSTTKDVNAIDCILFHRSDGAIYSIRGAKVQKIGISEPFFSKNSFIFSNISSIHIFLCYMIYITF